MLTLMRYKIDREDVYEDGGKGLLQLFKGDFLTMLRHFYPQHEWLPWKFASVPKGFWDHKSNRRQFFDWLGKELHCSKMEDWYKLKQEQIYNNGGAGLLIHKYNDSPMTAVMDIYPEHEWLTWRFSAL